VSINIQSKFLHWYKKLKTLNKRQKIYAFGSLAALVSVFLLSSPTLVKQIRTAGAKIFLKTDTKSVLLKTNTHLVVTLIKNQAADKITLTKASAITTSNLFPRSISGNEKYALEMVVGNKVINSYKFDFTEEIYPPIPNSPRKLTSPEAVIDIPYKLNTAFRVRDLKTRKVYPLETTLISQALAKPQPLLPQTAIKIIDSRDRSVSPQAYQPLDGYYDILYISEDYSSAEMDLFTDDVAALSSYLLSIAPFSEYLDKIRIVILNNSIDLGCEHDTTTPQLILCNLQTVLSVAAPIDYDTIVVVVKDDVLGGCGYIPNNVAVTYNKWQNGLAKQVAAHEMGHSIGWLMDEYDYGVGSLPSHEYPPGPNCDFPPCDLWSGVAGTGCYPTCGYDDVCRPTEGGCLMHDYNEPVFCPVCQNAIREVLIRHTTDPNSTPTPIQTVTLTPTTHPTLTPTTRPTPTPTMKPTPTPTKKPTPTPTPISLPTRKVFVSSMRYQPYTGGIANADIYCRNLAENANLPGKYIAWLSDDKTNAANRIPDAKYVLVNGKLIANNKKDLLDGSITNPIKISEKGQDIGYANVFTGTVASGINKVGYNCRNWISSSINNKGWVGANWKTTSGWTDDGYINCSMDARVYCFQISN